jgi:quinolinate synthase
MEIVKAIKRLKEEQDAVILAHNYQSAEIQELADFLGDSLALSRQAAETDASKIVFCGVKFMAETAKIISPEKTVLLPDGSATCPMANMVSSQDILNLKKQYPAAEVVCYVNSTAEVKSVSDVCCTSSNAQKVVESIPAQQIIFVPDRNLGSYCQRFTEKEIILWEGYCYVHQRISFEEVSSARRLWPDALLIVHPECCPEVIDLADEALSTDGMLKFVKKSNHKTFLIGTEEGLIVRLQRENPDKTFYAAGNPKICSNMKRTSLEDVYSALSENRTVIELPDNIMDQARLSLERMLAIV